ncbi:YwmB family TATA-box binding protein [Crassaminicella indica]|uniref:YwmB family TATA-box binding protein n=1 Tax=Crassaminicella indica TaxID=2855394 RepID=A0ABX8RCC6_9CLOT|nr:YwmB family TATA-box binding protein [Crassaminicella indica]QXM06702.1 YwmB family TATA-box binding protein [Crassaminicella indica]
MKAYFNFKKIFIYLFLMMNLLFMLSLNTVAMTKEEGIIKAFKSTDGAVEEINIHAYVTMDKSFTSPSKAKEILMDLSKKLALKDQQIEDASIRENIHIYITGKGKNDEAICIIVQSSNSDDLKETNIVIDAVDEKIEHLTSLSQNIKEALDDFGKVNITSCITGSFKGKLDNVQKEEVVENIIKSMDAVKVEVFRDENMISITSFSSKIKKFNSYGGRKVNLQIALRYNSYNDKTNIWIGAPFIAIGY